MKWKYHRFLCSWRVLALLLVCLTQLSSRAAVDNPYIQVFENGYNAPAGERYVTVIEPVSSSGLFDSLGLSYSINSFGERYWSFALQNGEAYLIGYWPASVLQNLGGQTMDIYLGTDQISAEIGEPQGVISVSSVNMADVLTAFVSAGEPYSVNCSIYQDK